MQPWKILRTVAFLLRCSLMLAENALLHFDRSDIIPGGQHIACQRQIISFFV